MRCFNFNRYKTVNYNLVIGTVWLVILSQQVEHSSGLFFPLFANFFNKFRYPNSHFGGGPGAAGANGGVSVFSGGNGGNGNATLIRVPMFRTPVERRIDVVTTVMSNPADESQTQIEVHSNVSNTVAAESMLHAKLAVPTSTSMTSSVSSSSSKSVQANLDFSGNPSTLTLPFTPNMFGMMSYMQAMKDIKRNFKDQEKERKMAFHNKDAGDLMTRILRTLIQKVVNKYQKQTEILKLKISKRQDCLQKFLQLPFVSQVMTPDQGTAPAGQPVALGKDGGSMGAGGHQKHKPASHLLSAFMI